MEKWIEVMLNNSILMSVVILLILLLTKLFFKKHLAKWRYYTWIVIIVGLLVPYRPTFDIIPVQIEPPVQFAAQATIPVISEQFESYDLQTNETEKPSEPVPPESNKITFNWSMVIVAIWAFGFFASLMHCFLKHRSFLNAVRRWSCDVDKENISELLDEAKAELNIANGLEVKTCKIVSTPMLIGFINPIILLPSKDFEYDELELIIRHELTHYKRKDLWYKGLVLFTNAVHWFNPFVYMMARAIITDCEMSCDEAVLKDKDMQQRMLYGETIISIIKNQSSVSTAFSTGFKGGKKTMEKRMFSIMDNTKKKTGIVLLCIVLSCTVLTGMTNIDKQEASISNTTPIKLNDSGYTYLAEVNKGQLRSERVMFEIESSKAFLYLEIEDYSEPFGIKVFYGDTDKLVLSALDATFAEGGISGFLVESGKGLYSVELTRSKENTSHRVTVYGVLTESFTDYENITLPQNKEFLE